MEEQTSPSHGAVEETPPPLDDSGGDDLPPLLESDSDDEIPPLVASDDSEDEGQDDGTRLTESKQKQQESSNLMSGNIKHPFRQVKL